METGQSGVNGVTVLYTAGRSEQELVPTRHLSTLEMTAKEVIMIH